ncbi:MAG: DUF3450 family protein [Opitutales bacterium]
MKAIRCIMFFIGLMPVLVSVKATASPEALENARSTVKEWAAAEKTISREIADWSRRKDQLKDLIEVADRRIERFEKELEKGEATLSEAEKEREKLHDRRVRTEAETERIKSFLAEIEAGLRELRPRLPTPLGEKLAPVYQRVPKNEAKTSVKLGERMRTVMQLLAQIRQFDGKLTVTESLRELPESDEEELVRELYLGLGQAYYIAPDDVGFGWPGSDGWVWKSKPGFEKAIRKVFELVEADAIEPKLVDLPVQLSGTKGDSK